MPIAERGDYPSIVGVMPTSTVQFDPIQYFPGISMDTIFRVILVVFAFTAVGAGFRTPNFMIEAPTAKFAKEVGEAAEIYRRELAIEWTGKPLPGNWKHACPITVKVGNMGAGGATTFNFQAGEVYGWKMEIQGCEQRILDSVLPHEINHTIFASHFRRPLPRWADEGAASLIEHDSERNRLREIHSRVMGTNRRIPLRTLLDIKQYPPDKQDVLTLYAEGHSLADFLIQQGSKPQYLKLMEVAYDRGWEPALAQLYGYSSVELLEKEWNQWVMAGSTKLNIPAGSQVATSDRNGDRNKAEPPPIIRGQNPAGSATRGGEPKEVLRPARKRSDQELDELVSNNETRRSRSGLLQPLMTVNAIANGTNKIPQDSAPPSFER